MKTTGFRGLIPAFVFTVALTALSLVPGARVSAQVDTPQFKVGDRVEVDTNYTSGGADRIAQSTSWRRGTIVKLYDPDNRFGGYILKLDGDGREFRNRFIDKQWIRPAQSPGTGPVIPPGEGPQFKVGDPRGSRYQLYRWRR